MKAIASILAVLALSALTSIAADAPKGDAPKGGDKPKMSVEERFKKLDANGDGKLSKEEFTKGAKDAARSEKFFASLDTDKDGSVSLEEYKAGAAKKGKKGDAPKGEPKKGDAK